MIEAPRPSPIDASVDVQLNHLRNIMKKSNIVAIVNGIRNVLPEGSSIVFKDGGAERKSPRLFIIPPEIQEQQPVLHNNVPVELPPEKKPRLQIAPHSDHALQFENIMMINDRPDLRRVSQSTMTISKPDQIRLCLYDKLAELFPRHDEAIRKALSSHEEDHL